MVALVTGGAKRVGRAIVLALARAGWDVAVHFRSDPETAAEVAGQVTRLGRQARTFQAELKDPRTWPWLVEQTIAAFGRLDLLVNNASVFLSEKPDTLDDFDLVQWESIQRTNVVAPAGLCRHARKHLAAHGRGCIINLCDIAAERPWPGHLAYGASKAALVALTKALVRALADGP